MFITLSRLGGPIPRAAKASERGSFEPRSFAGAIVRHTDREPVSVLGSAVGESYYGAVSYVRWAVRWLGSVAKRGTRYCSGAEEKAIRPNPASAVDSILCTGCDRCDC